MSSDRDAAAIANLEIMIANGELHFPEPWTTDAGHVRQSWDPEADGDLLACYMDILGLNGRAPAAPPDWRGRRELNKPPQEPVAAAD